ncbi:hypothetical protein AAFC00_001647 [Neodothiora populina]|uniref:Spindle assembly checkpoint component MAD1 n=1 Tax=Neodothiora populina TaxID=2781224 RepID=A0ABR3PPP4_9PEZI
MSKFQPTYDFLAGDSPPPRQQPLRETFRQSIATTVRPDIANESLRAQLNTLQYELDSLKQEKELATLEHQSEIREIEYRAEADFKRAQAAESSANAATKKAEALVRELQEAESRATNEKIGLERRIRTLQEDTQNLREELEDVETQLSSAERQHKHGFSDLEARHTALQASFEEAQRDLDSKVNALQSTQQRLSQREVEVGTLENEILRLKAQTGDADTLSVIKRELSDQVAHIRNLESTNQKQLSELKQLRKTHKSVEIVEEEKRVLESKVRIMADLRKELAEAQLQQQILEDEKRSWTSYLESQAAGNEDMKYDSPQDLAKAFVAERFERLSLMERLGAIEPELAVKDDSIRTLEDDKAQLNAELIKLKTTSNSSSSTAAPTDNKALARLQRQKNLAVKEVEYLRAQMKALEDEQIEFDPETVDEEAKKRAQELESIIDQYRAEVETLQADLTKLEANPPTATPPTATPAAAPTLKRAHEEDSDERLGELRRKMRSLNNDLSQLQTRNATLEAELQANVSQLKALRESSKTRVLEFRDNPTAQTERIKMKTLSILKEENKALLDQLEGRPNGTKVVPISTLDNVREQMAELEATIAQRDKKQKRLKDIWTAKFLEFAEAVASVLGWRVVFQPNGRFKVTSVLYPTHLSDDGEEEENSILFDGEKGTMKVSGGEKSVFANEIRPLIEFWVDGRKEIPCFLAACTLEFYDRTTRAADAT